MWLLIWLFFKGQLHDYDEIVGLYIYIERVGQS